MPASPPPPPDPVSAADRPAMATDAPVADRYPAAGPLPRRVLIVSADIGGGHDATGRALAEQVRGLWPGSRVGWVDTLAVMGPGMGPVARRTYVTNVETTPWLYECCWAALWRHRRFARWAKRFMGGWVGRRLVPVVDGFDPDLILSTYPLGSAGLAWLRDRRGLGVPVGAWVSDFAPHPFWIYPELDLHLVVHPAALPVAAVAAPGARLGVCAPPVTERFRPGDRDGSARRARLDPARPVVVVSCGSYGFGPVDEAIRALTATRDDVQVVAVCGRNARLAARLAALDVPAGRLTVRRWVEDMPTLLRAADLLVTNAGGATVLEAWATGTPVVLYRPIAAHGRANAALMTAASLAGTAHTPGALAACARTALAAGPGTGRPTGAAPRSGASTDGAPTGNTPVAAPPTAGLPALGVPAVAAAGAPRPAGAVAAGGTGPTRGPGRADRAGVDRRRPPAWPLRPQDAFFRHVETPDVAQQIGVVAELAPLPDGRPLDRTRLLALLERRLPDVTILRRRLVDRGRWRRPGWVVDRHVDPAAHLSEIRVGPDHGTQVAAALDRFWSRALPTDRPMWHMLLITGLPDGTTRLAVKLHHSLGDGVSAIGALRRLLDRTDGTPPAAGAAGRTGPAGGHRPAGPRLRERLRGAASVARGLARLAVHGPAPVSPLNRPLSGPHRHLVTATLPTADLLSAARCCRVRVSELLCALAADALRRSWPADRPVPPRLRAMLAVSRDPRQRAPGQGNWTGAVTLDLPLAPAAPHRRVATVRDRLRRALAGGEPVASGLVVRAMGVLPAPLHTALARRIYSDRFMNVIVSPVPGRLRRQALAGAPVRWAAPVVGLASGVPLGVGFLHTGERTGVGVLVDAPLAGFGERFAAGLRDALADLCPPQPAPGPDPETGPGPGLAPGAGTGPVPGPVPADPAAGRDRPAVAAPDGRADGGAGDRHGAPDPAVGAGRCG